MDLTLLRRRAWAWFRRLSWSVYGRHVWDRQHAHRSRAIVERTVGLLGTVRSRPGEHVLDAGCGTGDVTVALALAGVQVTGLDYAPGMLARARSKLAAAPAGSVTLRQASLDERLPFADATFDRAVMLSVLQAVADPARTLRELRRVLRPGGTLVVVHYPRPALHDLPLLAEVRARLDCSGSSTPHVWGLVLAKSWAERMGATRYWTAGELAGLLRDAGFRVASVEQGAPLIVVAERSPVYC